MQSYTDQGGNSEDGERRVDSRSGYDFLSVSFPSDFSSMKSQCLWIY
jgi:hypothetical protein